MSQSSKWLALIVLVLALWSPAPGPAPEPTPDPAPVVETGFRVLFVYESQDTLTSSQQAAMWSGPVVAYLNEKCAKVNGQPERRWWDDDQDVSKDTATMREMRTHVDPAKLPYLVVSNGKTGYAGPVPENAAALLELLKKYGG